MTQISGITIERAKNGYPILAHIDLSKHSEFIPLLIKKGFDLDIAGDYLCDPYDISPSGDIYWADKRNIENLSKSVQQTKKDIKDGKTIICKTLEESLNHLESL